MVAHQHLRHLAARLDMAVEQTALLRGTENIEIAGVKETVRREDGICIHEIQILNSEGERMMHKPIGSYFTYELPPIEQMDPDLLVGIFCRDLKTLLPNAEQGPYLVVGLGNDHAAPDALGAAVVEKTYATRQLYADGQIPEGLGCIGCIAPGVAGKTGIDVAELLQGLCRKLHPAAVIAVDALAAASIRRVGTTIQMSDTGVRPGGGVGNSRPALDQKTLGCPVVAIGMPTLVDSAAIIGEALFVARKGWQKQGIDLPELDAEICDYTESELLSLFSGRLLMTPQNIDDLTQNAAVWIAAALAAAIHPACTVKNWHEYIRI